MLGSVITSLVLGVAVFCGNGLAQTPKLLGTLSAKHAAFLSLFMNDPTNPQPSARYTLLAASFDGIPFSKDYVFGVPKIGTYLNNLAGATVKTLTEKVTWPNDISGVPDSVFGHNMVAIPDGFLVPFKKKGSVSILNITSDPAQGPYQISDEDGKTEWFYHKVIWKDMDKDGLDDAVTCRARQKDGFEGQLVWFKNPGPPFFQSTWAPNVIANGPDVYLTPAALPAPGGNLDTILVPGYFSRRLTVYWIEGNGTWTNPDVVKSRVIDDNFEVGPIFDVQLADVNGDGKDDLLATSSNKRNGTVIVYEFPGDFRTGQFKKHVIASGFKPKGFGEGKSSPGSASIIRPSVSNTTSRPSIVLSGDDNGKAYILTPSSSQPDNWDYQINAFLEVSSGPVGSFAFGDVDGDGFTELFVPVYEKGEINVYTFKPPQYNPVSQDRIYMIK